MSILVCYEAGADILGIVVFKKLSVRYCTCSTCVATKNPSFGTCKYSFPKRLCNLTHMRGLNINALKGWSVMIQTINKEVSHFLFTDWALAVPTVNIFGEYSCYNGTGIHDQKLLLSRIVTGDVGSWGQSPSGLYRNSNPLTIFGKSSRLRRLSSWRIITGGRCTLTQPMRSWTISYRCDSVGNERVKTRTLFLHLTKNRPSVCLKYGINIQLTLSWSYKSRTKTICQKGKNSEKWWSWLYLTWLKSAGFKKRLTIKIENFKRSANQLPQRELYSSRISSSHPNLMRHRS